MNTIEKLDLIRHPSQYPTFGDTPYLASWQGAFFAFWWDYKATGLHHGYPNNLPSLGERHRTAHAALIEEGARLYASPQSEGRRNVFRRAGEGCNAYIYTDDPKVRPPTQYKDLLRWLARWDTQAAREAPYTTFFHCLVAQATDELVYIERVESGVEQAAEFLRLRAIGEVQTIHDV